jgi:hypothetical protein
MEKTSAQLLEESLFWNDVHTHVNECNGMANELDALDEQRREARKKRANDTLKTLDSEIEQKVDMLLAKVKYHRMGLIVVIANGFNYELLPVPYVITRITESCRSLGLELKIKHVTHENTAMWDGWKQQWCRTPWHFNSVDYMWHNQAKMTPGWNDVESDHPIRFKFAEACWAQEKFNDAPIEENQQQRDLAFAKLHKKILKESAKFHRITIKQLPGFEYNAVFLAEEERIMTLARFCYQWGMSFNMLPLDSTHSSICYEVCIAEIRNRGSFNNPLKAMCAIRQWVWSQEDKNKIIIK